MRSLSTLATLLLGLAFVYWAPTTARAAPIEIDQSAFGPTATVIDFDDFPAPDIPVIPGIISITSPTAPAVLLIDPCCPSAWGSGDPGRQTLTTSNMEIVFQEPLQKVGFFFGGNRTQSVPFETRRGGVATGSFTLSSISGPPDGVNNWIFFGFEDVLGIDSIFFDFNTIGSCCVIYGIFDLHLTPGPPTAVAGADQTFRAGDTVFLDGSASFDEDTSTAALVYAWSFSSLPAASTTTLFDDDTAFPSFVADVAGTYTVQLIVTDEEALSSIPDEVVISSNNLAPTAVAGDDQLLVVGETAFLDGSGSTDPESDPLTYSWTITSAPAGSTATLSGEGTAFPTFVPDLEGVYVVELVVSDFIGPGAPADTVEITATTVEDFAEVQILLASDLIASLLPEQVTSSGNQRKLLRYLTRAITAIQDGNIATATKKIGKAIERTDGCVLRGVPDEGGRGRNNPARDWIIDCEAQEEVYTLLTDALDALTP